MRVVLAVVGGAALLFAAGVATVLVFDAFGGETTTVDVIGPHLEGGGLPQAVAVTRAELLVVAETGDYDALRRLIRGSGFTYTFGGPVEGGPIAYWRELERTTDERPLRTLAALLKMPYALSRGTYVWPWAYSVAGKDDLSPHERALLAPMGALDTLFVPGTGYLGWRIGIKPDGTWQFFVAGD